MTNMIPSISVLLPTYNGAQFVAHAIKSVLDQSFKDLELLVIDDGSTDNTADIVKSLAEDDNRIHYLRNEKNLGIQKTLNRGLREARGEYVARIDDDDEWIDREKLEKQIEFLSRNFEYVLIGTGAVVVDEKGKELTKYIPPKTDSQIRKRILSKNCFVHSSVLFQKKAALLFGGYDESESARHVEDYDLWLKLGTKGKLANLPIHSVKFTLRPGAISSQNKIKQFKRDMQLAEKYRSNYPCYVRALLKGYLRLILYPLFVNIPLEAAKNKILKLYKEY